MLAWVVGGAALWVVAGAAVAFLVAAVIGRSCRTEAPAPAGEAPTDDVPIDDVPTDGAQVEVPAQRAAPPTGLRSQPHLPCAGVGRSPSHR